MKKVVNLVKGMKKAELVELVGGLILQLGEANAKQQTLIDNALNAGEEARRYGELYWSVKHKLEVQVNAYSELDSKYQELLKLQSKGQPQQSKGYSGTKSNSNIIKCSCCNKQLTKAEIEWCNTINQARTDGVIVYACRNCQSKVGYTVPTWKKAKAKLNQVQKKIVNNNYNNAINQQNSQGDPMPQETVNINFPEDTQDIPW